MTTLISYGAVQPNRHPEIIRDLGEAEKLKESNEGVLGRIKHLLKDNGSDYHRRSEI